MGGKQSLIFKTKQERVEKVFTYKKTLLVLIFFLKLQSSKNAHKISSVQKKHSAKKNFYLTFFFLLLKKNRRKIVQTLFLNQSSSENKKVTKSLYTKYKFVGLPIALRGPTHKICHHQVEDHDFFNLQLDTGFLFDFYHKDQLTI